MLFNHKLLEEVRKREAMRKGDFARLIGMRDSHLSLMESGQRRPSFEMIGNLVRVTGIPVEKWLTVQPEPDNGEIFWLTRNDAHAVTNMKNRLSYEHQGRLRAEDRVWELEQTKEHLTAEIRLHEHFENILCAGSLTKYNKMEKLKKLAVWTMADGELCFDEIRRVLKVKRSVLRNWLDAEKQVYKCHFANGGEILASSPGEAALCLCCYDCSDFEAGECFGYGNEKRPEGFLELLDRLEMHGIYDRDGQADILKKYYNISLSLEEIANIKYRIKNGLSVPDEILYLDMRKKK